MNDYEEVYRRLRTHLTDEEIADSMMLPADLTQEQRAQADAEIRAFRFKLLSERIEAQRIYADLLRFRYQMEDYLATSDYDERMKFGTQLSEYIRILKRTKKQVSEELNVHYTKLSRILNDREAPNVEFMYRLEEHSGELAPALLWWKLWMKKQAYDLMRNTEARERAVQGVTRVVDG